MQRPVNHDKFDGPDSAADEVPDVVEGAFVSDCFVEMFAVLFSAVGIALLVFYWTLGFFRKETVQVRSQKRALLQQQYVGVGWQGRGYLELKYSGQRYLLPSQIRAAAWEVLP